MIRKLFALVLIIAWLAPLSAQSPPQPQQIDLPTLYQQLLILNAQQQQQALNLAALQKQLTDTDAHLTQQINQPSWVTDLIKSTYFQVAITALGTALTTWRVTK